jgi:uncharacterized protein with HEPN domain
MRNGSSAEALDRMLKSARQASVYVEGMDRESFLADMRTMEAVAMNFVVIGEMAAAAICTNRAFVERYPDFSWALARGMRNQIVHNYAETNFEVVWRTTVEDLPVMIEKLPAMIAAADAEWPPMLESHS